MPITTSISPSAETPRAARLKVTICCRRARIAVFVQPGSARAQRQLDTAQQAGNAAKRHGCPDPDKPIHAASASLRYPELGLAEQGRTGKTLNPRTATG